MIRIEIDHALQNKFDKYSAYVSFDFDMKLVELMRTIPIRFYHKESKEWEVPVDKIDYIKQHTQIPIKIYGQELLTEKEDIYIPDGFNFVTDPFKHQIEGFNYGLSHTNWLLADEQGLGKTKQVIDIAVAKKIEKGYKHCLIICGVNGLKWNWYNEVNTHSNEKAFILGQRQKKNKIKIGSNDDKIFDLKHIKEIDAYFIITNVESLRNSEISNEIKKLCNENLINIIAVDEIHKCSNPSSQQSKGLLNIKCDDKIAMTGTPIMNKPLDLYLILKWLGYETHAFYSFKNHYCTLGGFGGYQVIGYKNLDELEEQLDRIMLRRLKEDVLDLPDKIYINEYVEMSAKQRKVYNEVFQDIKQNIDKIMIAPSPLAQLIRLRQATGYTGILSTTIKESAKLDRLVELVDESVENGKKVVIFSNWTQMTDAIKERLINYHPELITGEQNINERKVAVDTFQNDDNCKVIIGTIGAMGTGLTLTAGTVVIFMDEPWTRAAYDQAVDRCHRIGTTENITIYNLLTKDTIDERIHQIVTEKGAMSDLIVDGKITDDKSQLLDFLLG